MIFHQLQLGNMENFCHIIGDKKTNKVAIFDPGWEGKKILQFLEKNNYTLTHIFLTHVHYDHSGQADFLAQKTGAKIFLSEKTKEEKRGHPKFIVPQKFLPLCNHQIVMVGNVSVKTLDAPGHQDDHVIFIVGEKYLVTGDTLFVGSIGGLHFEYSVPKKMPNTLQMINTLPDDLLLCSGHDYGEVKMRTLGEEKKNNPYLMSPELALEK